MKMRIPTAILFLSLLVFSSCLNLEEEPIVMINPSAQITAHVKDKKIYATGLITVNPQVLSVGNIPIIYEFTGELAIWNTNSGTIIDGNSLSGGGLSQVYTVSADTTGHDRFIVIASGSIKAFADINNDGEESNNKLVSEGDFYQESQFIVSELVE
ncbi:MAG: hypothetical protein GY790_20215 [Bacteroidetes bacterium]|nr:hypothetical protein [Bacteroidota bacterium]